MEYQLREQHFLVIETHSDSIKAGSADIYKLPHITIPFQRSGTQSIIDKGHVEDWDTLEHYWHRALKELHVKKSRNHSPVLLTVPSTFSRLERERIVQIFFEKFNVPGLFIADYPLMVLYGFGKVLSGVVVEVSSDCVIVTPIIEAVIQTHAILVLPVGARDIREHLRSLLLSDSHFMASLNSNISSSSSSVEIGDDLLEFIENEVLEMSATQLESVDRKREKEISRFDFEYNGHRYSIGEARLKAVEILFNPKAVAKGGYSLAEIINESILKCELDKRAMLLENCMLTGAFCKIRGFKGRVEKEVKKLLPQTDFCNEFQPKDIKFLQMPDYLESYKGQEEHAAFLGASVVSKLVFPDMKNYMTKLDYNEYGPTIAYLKGY